VDPVLDPLLLGKSGSAGNQTRGLLICSVEVWPLDHGGGHARLSSCLIKHYLIKKHGRVKVLLHEFHTSTLDGGEWPVLRPAVLLRAKSPRYPLVRRLGGPQNRSGSCGEEKKSLAPTGNGTPDSSAVEHTANHYTEWTNGNLQSPTTNSKAKGSCVVLPFKSKPWVVTVSPVGGHVICQDSWQANPTFGVKNGDTVTWGRSCEFYAASSPTSKYPGLTDTHIITWFCLIPVSLCFRQSRLYHRRPLQSY
jgi:hypothetical protein